MSSPHGHVAAINNNRLQVTFGFSGVLQRWPLCSRWASSPMGQTEPTIITVRARGGHSLGPWTHQLPQHRVGVRPQAELPQGGLHLLWRVTQLTKEVDLHLQVMEVRSVLAQASGLMVTPRLHPAVCWMFDVLGFFSARAAVSSICCSDMLLLLLNKTEA